MDSCEAEAVYRSHFSSLFAAPMSMHVQEGTIFRLKVQGLNSFLLGIANHFENIEAPVVIKGISLLNGHLFVVA